MAKNGLSPTLMENEQVKNLVDFAKLLAKLNDKQKAKLEGIAIGMSLEKTSKNSA